MLQKIFFLTCVLVSLYLLNTVLRLDKIAYKYIFNETK